MHSSCNEILPNNIKVSKFKLQSQYNILSSPHIANNQVLITISWDALNTTLLFAPLKFFMIPWDQNLIAKITSLSNWLLPSTSHLEVDAWRHQCRTEDRLECSAWSYGSDRHWSSSGYLPEKHICISYCIIIVNEFNNYGCIAITLIGIHTHWFIHTQLRAKSAMQFDATNLINRQYCWYKEHVH